MDAESTQSKGKSMIELPDKELDRLLLTVLNLHTEAFPQVGEGIAGSRAMLRRFLTKRISVQDKIWICSECKRTLPVTEWSYEDLVETGLPHFDCPAGAACDMQLVPVEIAEGVTGNADETVV